MSIRLLLKKLGFKCGFNIPIYCPTAKFVSENLVFAASRIESTIPYYPFRARFLIQSFHFDDGRTLYEAQQILGHSDPKVTMRYAHLSTKALREAANSAAVKIRG